MNNAIQTIPKELESLSQLQYLKLDQNLIK